MANLFWLGVGLVGGAFGHAYITPLVKRVWSTIVEAWRSSRSS